MAGLIAAGNKTELRLLSPGESRTIRTFGSTLVNLVGLK